METFLNFLLKTYSQASTRGLSSNLKIIKKFWHILGLKYFLYDLLPLMNYFPTYSFLQTLWLNKRIHIFSKGIKTINKISTDRQRWTCLDEMETTGKQEATKGDALRQRDAKCLKIVWDKSQNSRSQPDCHTAGCCRRWTRKWIWIWIWISI